MNVLKIENKFIFFYSVFWDFSCIRDIASGFCERGVLFQDPWVDGEERRDFQDYVGIVFYELIVERKCGTLVYFYDVVYFLMYSVCAQLDEELLWGEMVLERGVTSSLSFYCFFCWKHLHECFVCWSVKVGAVEERFAYVVDVVIFDFYVMRESSVLFGAFEIEFAFLEQFFFLVNVFLELLAHVAQLVDYFTAEAVEEDCQSRLFLLCFVRR